MRTLLGSLHTRFVSSHLLSSRSLITPVTGGKQRVRDDRSSQRRVQHTFSQDGSRTYGPRLVYHWDGLASMYPLIKAPCHRPTHTRIDNRSRPHLIRLSPFGPQRTLPSLGTLHLGRPATQVLRGCLPFYLIFARCRPNLRV